MPVDSSLVSLSRPVPVAARTTLAVPLYGERVRAGFPSPADDYIEQQLDFNEYLVRHPAATFCVRVAGDSMLGAGIFPGDLLVVDRALEPAAGSIVVAVVDGELTVKRLVRAGGGMRLVAENPAYPPLAFTAEGGFEVWGVVSHVVRRTA